MFMTTELSSPPTLALKRRNRRRGGTENAERCREPHSRPNSRCGNATRGCPRRYDLRDECCSLRAGREIGSRPVETSERERFTIGERAVLRGCVHDRSMEGPVGWGQEPRVFVENYFSTTASQALFVSSSASREVFSDPEACWIFCSRSAMASVSCCAIEDERAFFSGSFLAQNS